MEGVLLELSKPLLADDYTLLLFVIFSKLVSVLMSFLNDISHVLCSQCTENSKEELSLWKLT